MIGEMLFIKVGHEVLGPCDLRTVCAIVQTQPSNLCLVKTRQDCRWISFARYLREHGLAPDLRRGARSAVCSLPGGRMSVAGRHAESVPGALHNRSRRAVLSVVSLLFVGVVVALSFGLVGGTSNAARWTPVTERADASTSQPLLADFLRHSSRSEDDRLSVVEFGDLADPAAAKRHVGFKRAASLFGKEIRYTFYPLVSSIHGQSLSFHAAVAVKCARKQTKSYRAVERIYKSISQGSTFRHEELVRDLGIDFPAYRACLTDPKSSKAVVNLTRRTRAAGIVASAVFVNGQALRGDRGISE